VIRTCTSTDVPVQWRLIGKAVLEDGGGGLPPEIKALVEPPIHTADDLNAAYRWADVLILPSYYEGLPLTVVEAMRLGVVVIATDVGAVSEVLMDGKTGVLLRTEDVASECVRALSTLAGGPGLLWCGIRWPR
jgi:glycosyltransferase involved in cell wall biosynthesis